MGAARRLDVVAFNPFEKLEKKDIYAHVMQEDQALAVQAMDQFFSDSAAAV